MGKTIAQGLIEQGEKKGRQTEKLLRSREMLLRLLKNKFGKIPAAAVKQIETTERIDHLEAWFDQASIAKKLEDVSFEPK